MRFHLLAPQNIATDEKNNRLPRYERTQMIINASSSVLLLDKQTKTKKIMHRQEMSTTVTKCNIDFSFFGNFDKVVNTFVNARDMHAFSTIRNKIQVKDDDNDLSIRKKLDKSSEAERKEAYEKASLEHKQSRYKQDIFLENNLKNVYDIIKAMTPETLKQERMTLLEIHDRTNHCVPIIFNSKLASC